MRVFSLLDRDDADRELARIVHHAHGAADASFRATGAPRAAGGRMVGRGAALRRAPLHGELTHERDTPGSLPSSNTSAGGSMKQ
jgi:hypothetical protein